jgi:hypothetical protein
VLGSIDGEYDAVRYYDSCDREDPWKNYHASKPASLNDLSHIDPSMGIWVHIKTPGGTVLSIVEEKVSYHLNITLHQGWNLVGYPSLSNETRVNVHTNQTLNESIDKIITYNTSSHQMEEIALLDYFIVGQGYWIYANKESVWEIQFGFDDVKIHPGFGNFTYHDDGDNTDRPVNVYYYRPDNFPDSDSKVIFTMHGSARNAPSARNRSVPYADRYNTLLIAPEFSIEYYPNSDDYNRGFVKDGGGTGNLRARSDWTFLTIEEIFDIVLAEIPDAPSIYSIHGNSGGGHFVSRLPLIVPEARIEVAAGSNSGWYTLPTRDESYPNGIGDLDITDEQIEQVYSKKVVTVVGEDDTDPYSYQLEHNEFTDMQGDNRYERALWYYDYMMDDAAARGVHFNWDILVAENVGHPTELIVHATAGAVFAGATTHAEVKFSPLDDTYIDESYPSEVFGESLVLRVDGGNQEIVFLKFDLCSVGESVDVAMIKLYITKGANGQQFVHEVDNSWTESTLTWYTSQPLGEEIGRTTGGQKETILYIEVTDYINENIGGEVSLAIQTEDTDSLRFSSSEASYFPIQLDLFSGS